MRMCPKVPDGVVTRRARNTVGMPVGTSSSPTATRVTSTAGSAMSAAARTAAGANICFLASFTACTDRSSPWAARPASPVPSAPPGPATATRQSSRISRCSPSRPR